MRRIQDADELADWFLYHMTQDQRFKLMAERPVLYARIYPNVNSERIAEVVQTKINSEREHGSSPTSCAGSLSQCSHNQ